MKLFFHQNLVLSHSLSKRWFCLRAASLYEARLELFRCNSCSFIYRTSIFRNSKFLLNNMSVQTCLAYMLPSFKKANHLWMDLCDTCAHLVKTTVLFVFSVIRLCGFEPFFDERGDQYMFKRILNCEYEFVSPWWDNVSLNAKDLVSYVN